jgi:F-type H+-transporting ATPase subunit delta
VISLTVARKYARALLEIGLQEKNYDALGKDLGKIVDLLKENKELRSILASPFYPLPARKAIAKNLVKALGLSKPVDGFIDLLIERERMDHFAEIIKCYDDLCDGVARRLRATLVTAHEMPSVLVSEIKGQLESTTGKEVILSIEEDSSLIGGVLTKIGNVIYDGSLKTQLLKVKENLYKE